MNNSKLRGLLEEQRDAVLYTLSGGTISGLYKAEYEGVKLGVIYYMDRDKKELLAELSELAKDTSHDAMLKKKLEEYFRLDHESLITYFCVELEKIFSQIRSSGVSDSMQALFIEYDYYYHYDSAAVGYGRQAYPESERPVNMIMDTDLNLINHNFVRNDAINFSPAWLDCSEFEAFETIDVEQTLITLFQLHSRVMLHDALEKMNKEGKLDFLSTRPFFFYISEHDCETMLLYKVQKKKENSVAGFFQNLFGG